jgi:hypothetical protein
MVTSSRPRLAALIATLLFAIGLMSGCSNPKEKVKKKITGEVEECQNGKGTFHEVKMSDGSTKRVLRATCSEKMGRVQMPDSLTGKMQVGPYTWQVGQDAETGLWVLEGVNWSPLDSALNRLDRDSEDLNSIRAAVSNLEKAKEEFPSSGWIRLKLFETRLQARQVEWNEVDDIDPMSLGDEISSQLKSLETWALDNDNASMAAKARLAVADYYGNYIDSLKMQKSSVASDSVEVRLKKSAELAEEKGNKKEAKEYREELEKLRKERPKKIKRLEKKIGEATDKMCEIIGNIETEGLTEEVADKVSKKQATPACQ